MKQRHLETPVPLTFYHHLPSETHKKIKPSLTNSQTSNILHSVLRKRPISELTIRINKPKKTCVENNNRAANFTNINAHLRGGRENFHMQLSLPAVLNTTSEPVNLAAPSNF